MIIYYILGPLYFSSIPTRIPSSILISILTFDNEQGGGNDAGDEARSDTFVVALVLSAQMNYCQIPAIDQHS